MSTYTIKTLAEAAEQKCIDAGWEASAWRAPIREEITSADVATFLEVFLEEVGEDAPVSADEAAAYLESVTEWIDANEQAIEEASQND